MAHIAAHAASYKILLVVTMQNLVVTMQSLVVTMQCSICRVSTAHLSGDNYKNSDCGILCRGLPKLYWVCFKDAWGGGQKSIGCIAS